MNDYSMYKYFKGEAENPFDHETQNTSCQFWSYERKFEHVFNTGAEYAGKDKATELQKWLEKLFVYLSDRYDCFDDGRYFKTLYKIGETD